MRWASCSSAGCERSAGASSRSKAARGRESPGTRPRLAEWLKGQGIDVVADPRAGRLAARGEAAQAAPLRPLRRAGPGDGGARLRARARRSSGGDDPPGACRRNAGSSATASSIPPAPTRARPAPTPALLDLLDAIVVGSDRPDLTLILDVPAALGLQRARKNKPRARPLRARRRSQLHEARRQAFLDIAAREPERCVVIDATAREGRRSPAAIRGAVAERLQPGAEERRAEPMARAPKLEEERPPHDALEGVPLPRADDDPRRAPAAERALLDAYRSGRMHHGWILAGERGIGKATLAFRLARFIFAHPDPAAPEVAAARGPLRRAGASGGAPRRGRRARQSPASAARVERARQALPHASFRSTPSAASRRSSAPRRARGDGGS